MDYLNTFATRVRRLRETAGLSIQEACTRGELSTNFWGKVERGEQEPCLLSIRGIAQGLGTSPEVLITLQEPSLDNRARAQINDLLDLCNPDQWELALRIVKAIYDQGRARTTSPERKNM